MRRLRRKSAAISVLLTVLAAGGLFASEPASPPAISIPGGQLDPAYPGADVYLAKPESGIVPQTAACEAARRYVERVNDGDADGTSALFSDDAVILEPIRRTISGRAEIDEFYSTRLSVMKPHVVAVAYLANGDECMAELANRMEIDGQNRFVLVSIDHFILGEDGRFSSMVAFARPPRATGAGKPDQPAD